jgi:hypothetical protein
MSVHELVANLVEKQLNESELFLHDNKFLRQPMTLKLLTNYEESTSWLRANLFINYVRILRQIVVGFVMTGGGANVFDYLFRDKSSRLMIFADMPYHQEATYKEYKSGFDKAGIIMENDKFYMMNEEKTQVSTASEYMSDALCCACMDKMVRILGEQITKKYLAVSASIDFGSENDKPARAFIECKLGDDSAKKFGYLFSEKDDREKMNNTIAIIILNIIASEINDSDIYLDDMGSVEIDNFPKRTSELSKEENKKYYDKLYLLV